MKLGNTREEMQRNYSGYLKGARKVGKICMWIWLIAAVLSIRSLSIFPKVFIGLYILIAPFCGYAEGHILYFTWKRIEEWSIAIAPDDEGFFAAILGIIAFPIMFSVGQLFGIYDWVKIHIDGKRYGFKVQ